MTWFTWLVALAAVLVIAAVGLTAFGSMRWAAATQSLTADLESGRAPPSAPARYDASEIEGLPAPVQRYFRAALTPGQAIVSAATIAMTGSFNLSATGDQWKAFTSRQRVITRRPGFLWDARISMLPGLAVRVVDSYIGGKGLLRATIQGLYTMADMRGGGEIARGEFMRYFAEAAWYPTALLPSQGVRWEAVDDRSANATLRDGPITLTLLFRFDDAGLIESFRAEARGGMVGKVMVQAPWEGRFSNYQRRDGMSVPLAGEVAWMRPQGRRVYFKGAVTKLSYEFASPSTSRPGRALTPDLLFVQPWAWHRGAFTLTSPWTDGPARASRSRRRLDRHRQPADDRIRRVYDRVVLGRCADPDPDHATGIATVASASALTTAPRCSSATD